MFSKEPRLTNGQILVIHNQNKNLAGTNIEYFLKSSIENFNRMYNARLQALSDALVVINKKYFEQDEKGEPVKHMVGLTGQGEVWVEKLNPGMTIEGYQKEYSDIMNSTGSTIKVVKTV